MDIGETVEKSLRSKGASAETLDLWKEIISWYQEGGATFVKSRIKDLTTELTAEKER